MQTGAVNASLENLMTPLPETGREPGLTGMSIFRHGTLAEEHLVLLFWKAAHIPQSGSALGLRIKEMMSAFGLVDHSLWHLSKGEYHE
jgi:hypothetical protein